MSVLEKYDQWFSIHISHEYYRDGSCPISLVPDRNTKQFLLKAGVLTRKAKLNEWIFLIQSDTFSFERLRELIEDGFKKMIFGLYPLSDEFYYVSGSDNRITGAEFSTQNSSVPGIWKNIEITCKETENTKLNDVEVKLLTISKFWEYILIPKYNLFSQNIQLEEQQDKIQFQKVEKIQLFDGSEAFRISTTQRIKLNRIYSYRIKLLEIKNGGEKVLSNMIPCPRPEDFSVSDPRNTLTVYFYF